MSGKRASIFEAESELDVSGFAPKEAVTPKVRPEQVRAVSEAAVSYTHLTLPTILLV